MIDAELRKLAENFGKQLADSAAKHFSVSMSTAAAGKGKQYQPVDGRGGSANRSPLEGGGVIGSTKVLKEEVDRLSQTFKDKNLSSIMTKFGHNLALMANPKAAFDAYMLGSTEKRMDAIVGDAERAAEGLSGVHRKFADGLIEYVRGNGTNIANLHKNADLLNDLNVKLHKMGNDDEIGSKEMDEFVNKMEDLKDAMGEPVEFFEDMPPHLYRALEAIRADGMSRKALDAQNEESVKLFNEQQEALGWVTNELESTADTISNIGVSMTTNTQEMLRSYQGTMMKFIKGSAAAASYGMFQYMEDTVYRYQASIGRSYNSAAMGMGMSHRQVQDAMLDYRDTLRTEAALGGTDIYSDQSLDAMKRIQDLGKTFGLIRDEAFRFGMQMKDTSRLAGMANMSEQDMLRFYGESAKALNLTVTEFGEYFNTMAKDPAFLGFVNNMRMTGVNLQEAVTKEMANRIRMNKILGLSNENLQARLNLENAKRWQPIVERYRNQIGAAQLVRMYEEELNLAFTDSQKQLIAQAAFDPSTLTAAQQELFTNEIYPALMAGPELLQDKLNKRVKEATLAGNTALANQLTQQGALVKHLTSFFGDMSGQGIFNTENSATTMAAINNMAEATKSTPLEIVKALKDSNPEVVSGLQGYIDSVTGKLEDTIGKSDDPALKELSGINGTLTDFYLFAQEKLAGFAASGAAKAFGGIAGGAVGLGFEYMMHRRLLKTITGTLSTTAPIISGATSNIAKGLGGSYVELSKWRSMLGNSTVGMGLNNMGALKMLGSFGLVAAGGAALGYGLYKLLDDVGWFTNAADSVFGTVEKFFMDGDELQARKRQDNLIKNMSETPEFRELSKEQQQQVLDARKRRAEMKKDTRRQRVADIATSPADKQCAAIEKLNKDAQARFDAEAIIDPTLTPEQLLERDKLTEAKKTNELLEKGLVQDKEQGEELKGGFAQATDLANKARASSDGWQTTFDETYANAMLQYGA